MASPAASAAAGEPRTLYQARQVIASLRTKLGQSPAPPGEGTKPIPKTPEDPHPPGLPSRNPPINPLNALSLDLSSMGRASFERFISERTTRELESLLGAETGKGSKQDSGVIQKIYREIKKRRV